MMEISKPLFVDLLCTWHTYFCTNIGLKVKSWVLKCHIMKPMIELLKPMLELHKPMIVIFKHRLEDQTPVCNLETCVCRLSVHFSCHNVT